jgi:hypothetical protein
MNHETDRSSVSFIFHIIEERLQQSVLREEDTDFQDVRTSQQTFVIARFALLFVVLLTPPIFYLIWTLVGAMGIITDRMAVMQSQVEQMKTDFDQVALYMEGIERSVVKMSDYVLVIPPMTDHIQRMRDEFKSMTVAMAQITPNLVKIDHILGIMDQDMAEMSYVFGILNRDVFVMRRNVNQMSSPLRMMPFFGQ